MKDVRDLINQAIRGAGVPAGKLESDIADNILQALSAANLEIGPGWNTEREYLDSLGWPDPDEMERLPWVEAIVTVPGGKPVRLPVAYRTRPDCGWYVLDSRKSCVVHLVRKPILPPEGGE